jgi:hypothetical protein
MWKKCKVVMLPTDEKATLLLTRNNKLHNTELDSPNIEYLQGTSFQHLYILSDDEIKEEDHHNWFYHEQEGVIFINYIKEESCLNNDKMMNFFKGSLKKIIASTDSSLIVKDTTKEVYGKSPNKLLPSIPQSFIDLFISEYNKGNKIEEVMVEYECELVKNRINCDECGYPSSESLYDIEDIKTSLKHNLILRLNSDNTINIQSVKDSWTREEVIGMLNQVNVLSCYKTDFDLEKWIKDNL